MISVGKIVNVEVVVVTIEILVLRKKKIQKVHKKGKKQNYGCEGYYSRLKAC